MSATGADTGLCDVHYICSAYHADGHLLAPAAPQAGVARLLATCTCTAVQVCSSTPRLRL